MRRETNDPGLETNRCLEQLTTFFGSERQLREIIPADIEGFKLFRKKQVSGATVNRELALLKRMFNLAIGRDLYLGTNPVRKVKFFQELNLGFRILSEEEERKLLANATPYIQDLIVFDLNIGLRIGDVLSLRWEKRGFRERTSFYLRAQDTQDHNGSDQFGSPASLGSLGHGKKEWVRFL